MELYRDFVVEKFDDKPPPYSSSYNTSFVDSNPLSDHDIISGATIAKLLSKVEIVVCEKWTLMMVMTLTLQGPYVYELFSIMVHSGSAIGGHYYAYIKSVSQLYHTVLFC